MDATLRPLGLNRRLVVVVLVAALCGVGFVVLNETLREAAVLSEEAAEESAEDAEPTAEDIIVNEREGDIREMFPEEYLDHTIPELKKIAKHGPNKKKAQTALKLLRDGRFRKHK